MVRCEWSPDCLDPASSCGLCLNHERELIREFGPLPEQVHLDSQPSDIMDDEMVVSQPGMTEVSEINTEDERLFRKIPAIYKQRKEALRKSQVRSSAH